VFPAWNLFSIKNIRLIIIIIVVVVVVVVIQYGLFGRRAAFNSEVLLKRTVG